MLDNSPIVETRTLRSVTIEAAPGEATRITSDGETLTITTGLTDPWRTTASIELPESQRTSIIATLTAMGMEEGGTTR